MLFLYITVDLMYMKLLLQSEIFILLKL